MNSFFVWVVSISFFLAPFSVLGQTWKWAASASGGQSDKGLDIEMDEEGNLYVAGYYNYSALFGTIIAHADFGKEGFPGYDDNRRQLGVGQGG